MHMQYWLMARLGVDLAVGWTRVNTKKQVSMIVKYLNHTLQTIPQHHEAEPLKHNNHKTTGRRRIVNLSNQKLTFWVYRFCIYFFLGGGGWS